MSERTLTCINCPVGCRLTVTMEDGKELSVAGNTCKRGERYAHDECTNPKRVVTGLVRLNGRREPLSVKTAQPIPKDKVAQCVRILGETVLDVPKHIGDVVIENILDTGVDVVATKNIE